MAQGEGKLFAASTALPPHWCRVVSIFKLCEFCSSPEGCEEKGKRNIL